VEGHKKILSVRNAGHVPDTKPDTTSNSASKMTYIVSSGALNSTHSLTH